MVWIYAVIVFLLSEAWSLDQALSGTNQSTCVNSSISFASPKLYVVRNLTFNLGRDVNLTCSDKTWNETMFVIWQINLKSKACRIAFDNDGRSKDSCNDGKSVRNTSNAQLYLHIPNFSNADVGVYCCESVYNGGNENYKINVAITVPPRTSSWLKHEGNKMVAVCKAEGGKPAANISWSLRGNVSFVETLESDGFFTVESLLALPDGMDIENLTCSVRHKFWEGEYILDLKSKKGYIPWLCILTVVVIGVFLAGFLFFVRKKIIMLWRCHQSDISPSKYPPTEDVEEVEPYASYVQRVNSIYN